VRCEHCERCECSVGRCQSCVLHLPWLGVQVTAPVTVQALGGGIAIGASSCAQWMWDVECGDGKGLRLVRSVDDANIGGTLDGARFKKAALGAVDIDLARRSWESA